MGGGRVSGGRRGAAGRGRAAQRCHVAARLAARGGGAPLGGMGSGPSSAAVANAPSGSPAAAASAELRAFPAGVAPEAGAPPRLPEGLAAQLRAELTEGAVLLTHEEAEADGDARAAYVRALLGAQWRADALRRRAAARPSPAAARPGVRLAFIPPSPSAASEGDPGTASRSGSSFLDCEWTPEAFPTETWNLDALRLPSAIVVAHTPADVAAAVRAAAAVAERRRSAALQRQDAASPSPGAATGRACSPTKHERGRLAEIAAPALPLCVAGGRHSHLAFAHGALCIDLSMMRGVRVDVTAREVTCEGGALVGDLLSAMEPHGLGIPLGQHAGTGVGGLTLQGGHGHLERAMGLTCDALIRATVVTADGRIRDVSDDNGSEEDAELMWALRGGCGNFGVVTSFVFLAAPVGDRGTVMQMARVHVPANEDTTARPLVFSFADRQPRVRQPSPSTASLPTRLELLSEWRDTCDLLEPLGGCGAAGAPTATDADNVAVDVMLPLGGEIRFTLLHVGSNMHQARERLGALPIASFGSPHESSCEEVSFHRQAEMELFGKDMTRNHSGAYYVTSSLHKELPDAALSILARFTNDAGRAGAGSFVSCQLLGGKAARRPREATAVWHRDARFWFIICATFAGEDEFTYVEERGRSVQWARALKEALRPYSIGVYGQLSDVRSEDPPDSVGIDVDALLAKAATGEHHVSGKSMSSAAMAQQAQVQPESYAPTDRHSYGGNLPRLAAIKRRLDPLTLFSNTDMVAPDALAGPNACARNAD